MSTTYSTKANVTRILDASRPSTVITPTSTATINDFTINAVLAFGSVPAANNYSHVEAVNFVVRPSGFADLESIGLLEPFNPSTICYNEYPSISGTRSRTWTDGEPITQALTVSDDLGDYSPGIQAIKNGLLLRAYRDTVTFYTSAASESYKPYLQITFGDNVHLIPSGYPTQGYVDRQQALTLQWSNVVSGISVEAPYQQTAKLHWRMDGGSDHVINLTTAESYTIPANTLGSGTLIWSVEVKDSTGTTTASSEYRLSTVEPTSSAVALAPKNTSVDASNGVDFSWRHQISTGTAQTAADIQLSDDGTTWTDLAHPTGSATTYHAAPGTVASGTHYWRVRTYNQDSTAGSWSDPATFASVAPPLAPSVMATNVSRPTVSWTAAEQQAYEIQLDGVGYGPYFGQDTSWLAPIYLADGSHTAKVRVQNAYGLWSEWGAWTFTVSNAFSSEIALTAQSGERPILTWTINSGSLVGSAIVGRARVVNGLTFNAYLVYRDGILIASTTSRSYLDSNAAAGIHNYQVRGIYNNSGIYSLSNVAQAETIVSGAVIWDSVTGETIACPTVLEADRVIREAQSINVSFVHYAGAVWPVAEATQQRDNSYNFSPTWPRGQEPDILALLGREILVRDQYGGRVYGVLIRVTPETRQTRVRITMQIQQTAEPEVVL